MLAEEWSYRFLGAALACFQASELTGSELTFCEDAHHAIRCG
jgi:hypothetical protein